ncbi:MAG: hypothetical protein V4751_14510 [Pseudomonadota bacterium]
MFKKSLSEKLVLSLFCLSLFCLCLPALSLAQVGGSLVAYPPVEINLDISESADGMPVLSAEEIKLVTGEYYRLNVTSSGMTDWRLELPELLQNSHLRILTVNNGIEIHLQSMVFRAIEFDQPGKVSLSFTPIVPGTYAFTVGRNPIAQGLPRGQAGVQEADKRAEGRFVVE